MARPQVTGGGDGLKIWNVLWTTRGQPRGVVLQLCRLRLSLALMKLWEETGYSLRLKNRSCSICMSALPSVGFSYWRRKRVNQLNWSQKNIDGAHKPGYWFRLILHLASSGIGTNDRLAWISVHLSTSSFFVSVHLFLFGFPRPLIHSMLLGIIHCDECACMRISFKVLAAHKNNLEK